MIENKKYFIGLDIGTSSVGYCVTDMDYNVIKRNGHDMWGVMLFDEASTAEARRQKRSARRLVQRQKDKLYLLQTLFEKEINKVDPNFFTRLKASSYWEDDKLSAGIFSRNSLFFDSTIDDKAFYKKYKTIYHLRSTLLTQPAEDIRFLYLAIHNMMKHRGNFLVESFNPTNDDNSNLASLFNNLQQVIITDDGESPFAFLDFKLDKEKSEQLKSLDELLAKKTLKISEIVEQFKNIFGILSSNQVALLRAIAGGTVNAKAIFTTKENDKTYTFDAKLSSFSVEDEAYEQFKLSVDEVSESAGNIIDLAKSIYDRIMFRRILGDEEFFCNAMVNRYNLHKLQLQDFKAVMHKYYADKYNEMFKAHSHGLNNYAKYIDGSNRYSKEKKIDNKCTTEEFYKYVKSVLLSNPDKAEYPEVKKILDAIEQNNFLPKLRTSANSVIPYQVNKNELQKILKMSASKYKFLNEKDESGLTVADKIVAVFEFRIPYFVGPLSKSNSANAWIVKKLDEKITPWNFDKVVDLDACEQEFIQRMQNYCTYLSNEPVLPKNSLLYSEYMVLQELNNLSINGQRIKQEVKARLLDIFKNQGTLNISTVKNVVRETCNLEKNDEICITGVDGKFNSNLNIYKNLNIILDGKIEQYRNEVEDIIARATYVSDKIRLEKWLKKNYSSILNDKQIKLIKGLKIDDWGRLSKKFLDGIIGVDKTTGEARTIIDIMRSEPLNVMEILYKYDFQGALEQERNERTGISYEDVKGMYCSPSVKRGVWQTIKIVDEIEHIMGGKPEKIFVEVTREDMEKGKATDSRKTQMLNIYKSIKKDFDDNIEYLKQYLELPQTNLNSERLYLYFTQCGKCMYSGEPININELMSNLYDVDHIVPRSKIKDDSLDNKVLVKRECNIEKGDQVVPHAYQAKMKDFWFKLVDDKSHMPLISSKKLDRLLRTNEYTEDEQREFVNRQLVTTNQTAKAVLDLFAQLYGKDVIVYSKARFVSEFRNCEFKFDYNTSIEDLPYGRELKDCLVKCRDMNDLHHAKDAYLNIVVGNVFNEKYTKRFYLRKDGKYNYNIGNAFVNNCEGVFVKEKHIPKIIATMNSNTPYVNFLSREVHGQFYKSTIYGVDKHQKDYSSLDEIKTASSKFEPKWNGGEIPTKGENSPLHQTFKYGRLSDAKYSYFSLIKYTKKGVENKKFVAIPYLYAYNIKSDSDLKTVIERLEDISDFEIVIPKIRPGTIIQLGSGRFKIAGKTGDSIKLHNFNQLYLPSSMNSYFKLCTKAINKMLKKEELVREADMIVVNTNRFGEKCCVDKDSNLALYKELVKHLNKPLYRYTSINAIGKKLKASYDKFNSLDVMEQLKTINGMLNIINGTNGGDISNVGASSNSGMIKISNNLDTEKPIWIISASSTGFYEKENKLI